MAFSIDGAAQNISSVNSGINQLQQMQLDNIQQQTNTVQHPQNSNFNQTLRNTLNQDKNITNHAKINKLTNDGIENASKSDGNTVATGKLKNAEYYKKLAMKLEGEYMAVLFNAVWNEAQMWGRDDDSNAVAMGLFGPEFMGAIVRKHYESRPGPIAQAIYRDIERYADTLDSHMLYKDAPPVQIQMGGSSIAAGIPTGTQ